eukprot:gnl/MRDRNA2_/MRDRNA2_183464_c0_seq1.p2 gnl/MRDRNA2_/MRDRNA2_183464_c0~~gnl/MRDRNA2_/MRDRNA2_183464_c0_seq1.p2  ORF type:complete len:103 (-),score=32.27 gnl/MRDRNA2_/MRDRNA2_183464_c0_seq1:137-445(-)
MHKKVEMEQKSHGFMEEETQDEINDLKEVRRSAAEASKVQIELAQRIHSQVATKIKEQTNEPQQKLIAQHLEHQQHLKMVQEKRTNHISQLEKKMGFFKIAT